MSSDTVKIYTDHSCFEVPKYAYLDTLKMYEMFNVFFSFIDPRTDCLVQKNIIFYPESHKTVDNGFCFLGEHEGLPIALPADPSFWSRSANTRTVTKALRRSPAVLIKGRYVVVDVLFEVLVLRVSDGDRLPESA